MVTKILGESMLFALERHKDQMYGRKPYHVHLLDVVNVLRRFVDWDDLDQDFVDAAWLHDVVEDTGTPLEEVRKRFGERVADIVYAVTNAEGANRKERAAATYPKIRATSNALVIKLADRIANLEQCVSHDRLGKRPGRLFQMYLREWAAFQEGLRQRCRGEGATCKLMWEHIDKLIEEGKAKEWSSDDEGA
jgi:(p)ppGpp synthase/HD superfamily hydrolase